jgi:hypothetical protein
MNISLNPTYYCNFKCDFCYLTKQQLDDRLTISPNQLDLKLQEVAKYETITGIDLYGGEIGILKSDEFYNLKNIIRKHYKENINIITNYSMIHDWFFGDDITLSVSYDFTAREKNSVVYNNMLISQKPLSVLVLASKQVIDMNVDNMIQIIKKLKGFKIPDALGLNVIIDQIKSSSNKLSKIKFTGIPESWAGKLKKAVLDFGSIISEVDKKFGLTSIKVGNQKIDSILGSMAKSSLLISAGKYTNIPSSRWISIVGQIAMRIGQVSVDVDKKFGMVTMCVGTGQGCAGIYELI